LYEEYDFTDLKKYLTAQDNADWPFITTRAKLDQFIQIPKQNDITRLKCKECALTVAELDNELLFRFQYGGAVFIINLLERDTKWIQRYIDSDNNSMAYPAAMRKRFTGLKEEKVVNKAVSVKPPKDAN
jgi:hypothetical protein